MSSHREQSRRSPAGVGAEATTDGDRKLLASGLIDEEPAGVSGLSTIGRNVAWSYANWAVGFVAPLLLIPLFVRLLGMDLYGQWLVILSVVSYLGLADLGCWQAFGNRAAETIARGEQSALGRLLSSAFFAYSALAAVLLLAFAAFGPALRRLIAPSADDATFAALAVLFTLSVVAFPLKIHAMLLRSLERVDREQAIGLWTNLVRTALIALALLSGFKLLAIAAIHGCAVVAAGVAAYVKSARLSPAARPRLGRFSIASVRGLVRPGLAFWTLGISSTMVFGLDNLVIAYVMGAEAVTRYAVPMKLVMLPVGVFVVAFGSLWPTVTARYARHQLAELRSAFDVGVRVALLYGVAAAMALWLAGPAIIDAWAGPGVFPGRATFGLLISLLVVQVLLVPSDTVLMATTRHYGYAACALIEGALNLGLSLWWVHVFGLPGVIAATVVARLATNGWYMIVAANRTLAATTIDQLRRLAPGAAVAAVALASAAALPELSSAESIVAGALAPLAFGAAYCAVGLTRTEREMGFHLLGGIFRLRTAA